MLDEARPIEVEFHDGTRVAATEVHANDQAMDLAILKVDRGDLPFLELGDSSKIRQGQSIVAIGNPVGLEHSVVRGVVSSVREIDNRQMIQMAIPIEKGNSGGPVFITSIGIGRQGGLTFSSGEKFLGIVSAAYRQPMKTEQVFFIPDSSDSHIRSFDYMGLGVIIPGIRVIELLSSIK